MKQTENKNVLSAAIEAFTNLLQVSGHICRECWDSGCNYTSGGKCNCDCHTFHCPERDLARDALDDLKSAFQPVGSDSLGGPMAVRPSASGLEISLADVPLDGDLTASQVYDTLKPFMKYVDRLKEGPHKRAMVKAKNLLMFGVESLDDVETDPAPDHSTLLIEARESLKCYQRSLAALFMGPYTCKEEVAEGLLRAQGVGASTLSKLQSIKL